jgi:hypothetical protein
MLNRRAALVVSTLLAAACESSLAQQAVVTPIAGLLSPINNQPNSSSVGVNNAAHFVGLSGLYGFDPATGISYPGVNHSFLATDPNSAVDIGVLGIDPAPFVFPRPENTASAINSLDQISAYASDLAFPGLLFANVWLPSTAYGFPSGLVRLPSLTTPDIDRAFGLNDSGLVAGESRDASNNTRPVLWTLQNGVATVTDIAPGFGPNGRTYAVNSLGQAVGQVNEPNPVPFDNFFQAFIYLPTPAYGLPAGVNVLQAPGIDTADNFGFPVCINNLGQTFGRTGGGSWRPALWLPAPALGLPAGVTNFSGQVFPDAAFIRINSLGLAYAQFNAANIDGVAVGEAGFVRFAQFPRPRFFTESHGFIWRNGLFQLLEDFLPLNSPWQRIYWGSGINDSGVITALASDNAGRTSAVRITLDGAPCPSGITRQPASVSACAGDTAAFSVVVNGGGGGDVGYQWRFNGEPITDGPSPGGGTYQGASTLQLQIIGVGAADSGVYDVAATNTCGTLTSNQASLDVSAAPAYTTQPADAFACVTGSATFTAAVDDQGAGIGWQVEDPTAPGNYVPLFDGTNTAGSFTFDASGSSTGALVVTNFQSSGTARFQCDAFNGCGDTLSSAAALRVAVCTCSPDFNNDGDVGTDADIEAFFACLAGNCCPACGSADFNGDGDVGTDADIEAFFRVLAGGRC